MLYICVQNMYCTWMHYYEIHKIMIYRLDNEYYDNFWELQKSNYVLMNNFSSDSVSSNK